MASLGYRQGHHARQADMKTNTSKKSVWSTDDLHAYLDEAVHSFKVGQHWPQMLSHIDQRRQGWRLRGVRTYTPTDEPRSHAPGSDRETISHEHSSQAPLQAVPTARRSFRRKQFSSSFPTSSSTPTILAGAISPEQPTMDRSHPQATEEEEEESNAGGPAEGNDAEAQASAASKALADALATAARTEAQADAAKEKALNAGNAGAKADATRGATRVRRRKSATRGSTRAHRKKGSAGSYS